MTMVAVDRAAYHVKMEGWFVMLYKIASFNTKKLGRSSKRDFEKIAQIIVEEELDVVALQEIYSGDHSVKRLLEQCVKYELYGWDFCCAVPKETSDPEKMSDMLENDSRSEGYAYLWNKKRFKLLEFTKLGKRSVFEPRIINSLSRDVAADCSLFARTPYYIRLQPVHGGFFELRLIDVHVYFGDRSLSSVAKRKMEFDVLTKEIYPGISERRYGQNRAAYTIAMGDYNLNIFSPLVQTQERNCYLSQVHTYSDGRETVQVLTVQDQLTTLKKPNPNSGLETARGEGEEYANNFDHFTYSPERSKFVKVSYQTVDAVQKYCGGDFAYYRENISDHLPIVMTVEI